MASEACRECGSPHEARPTFQSSLSKHACLVKPVERTPYFAMVNTSSSQAKHKHVRAAALLFICCMLRMLAN